MNHGYVKRGAPLVALVVALSTTLALPASAHAETGRKACLNSEDVGTKVRYRGEGGAYSYIEQVTPGTLDSWLNHPYRLATTFTNEYHQPELGFWNDFTINANPNTDYMSHTYSWAHCY